MDREAAQVSHMEIGPKAVLGRVHAHRCDHEPVGQSQVLDGEGLEEQRHWGIMFGGSGLGGIGVLGQLGTEVGAGVGGDGDEEALLRVLGHELGLVVEARLRLMGGHGYGGGEKAGRARSKERRGKQSWADRTFFMVNRGKTEKCRAMSPSGAGNVIGDHGM